MFNLRESAPGWVRPPARWLRYRWRALDATSRALPSFVIIGAQKSGSTSLHHYLGQHPQLVAPLVKEVHYFDGGLEPGMDTFSRGVPWYRTHFPRNSELRPGQITYETSPSYIFNPLAASRIHELLPDARIVAILRDPTERAISHYFHERRRGREVLPLTEALLSEEARLRPLLASADYAHPNFLRCSYKTRGLYKAQLERYRELFTAQRTLVLSSEEMFSAPAATLRRVFEFVGVDADYTVPNLVARNVSSNRTDVDTTDRQYLDDFYAPHNTALFDWLGKTFAWGAQGIR